MTTKIAVIKLLLSIVIIISILSCRTSKVFVINMTQPPKDTALKEVKLYMTLDSLERTEGKENNLRAATNDGIFDYDLIGDGFPQQKQWFFDSLCAHQEAFVHATLDSLLNANHIQIRFKRIIAKGNFNCVSTGGLDAALDCNWTKIYKTAYANGAQPDFIHIFSYNNGYGTGNGGISITGVGNESLLTSSWKCPYYVFIELILAGYDPGREPKIGGHEDGHAYGLEHYFLQGGLMWYATSGGCALGRNYLPFQFPIILTYIKSRIGN